jgi:hypothetical protein
MCLATDPCATSNLATNASAYYYFLFFEFLATLSVSGLYIYWVSVPALSVQHARQLIDKTSLEEQKHRITMADTKSQSSETVETAPGFTCFPLLPAELQLEI